jgi:hypothetical protein
MTVPQLLDYMSPLTLASLIVDLEQCDDGEFDTLKAGTWALLALEANVGETDAAAMVADIRAGGSGMVITGAK